MSNVPQNPEDDQPDVKAKPAPWERRPQPPEVPAAGLHQRLQGAGEEEYPAADERQTGYLADDQQSLQSKIAGGGRDSGTAADTQTTRLCPACDRVTTFIQGVCSNCKHKLSGDQLAPAPDFGPAAYGVPMGGSGSAVGRNVLIGIIVVIVVAVIGYFGWQFLNRDTEGTTDEPKLAGVTTPDTFPGGLNAVDIDELFHEELSAAMRHGNTGWKTAGLDCYVYRYSLYEKIVPAESQHIIITGFVGGDDYAAGLASPGDAAFKKGSSAFFDKLNARGGVNISMTMRFTDGEETPANADRYVRYGYYYGKEHWDDIGPIVEALEGQLQQDGEYPHSLQESIVRPKIRTFGNLQFIANGFGFVPLFKTDANGKIIMGKGSGLAELLPEACEGYYLLVFTSQPDLGLDFLSPSDLVYYREKISPFPYQPKSALTNVPMEQDGKPDGIACIIKSGELVKL